MLLRHVKGVLLEDAQPTLDVAWLGDCRAFVARRSGGVERLTTDHSPDKERERIEAAGGMLVDDDGCVRVGVRPDDDAKMRPAIGGSATPTSSGPSPWSSRRRT